MNTLFSLLLTRPHSMRSRVYETVERPSVRPSVCPVHRQQQRRSASLLLSDPPHTPVYGPFSRTTRVSRYQKGKPIWILLKQEIVIGSGISWAICKSAPRSRQITTSALHHSVFYRPDALPAAQPTVSTHVQEISIDSRRRRSAANAGSAILTADRRRWRQMCLVSIRSHYSSTTK